MFKKIKDSQRKAIIYASLLVMIGTLFNIAISKSHGRLSSEITYDDNTYLFLVFKSFESLGTTTPIEFIDSFFDGNRAPVMTLIGLISFLFSGPNIVAVYLLWTLLQFGLLLYILYSITGIRPALFMSSVIFFSPLGELMAQNFKPDILYQIVFCAYLINLPKTGLRNFHFMLVSGISLIFIKSSYLPLTISLYAVTLIFILLKTRIQFVGFVKQEKIKIILYIVPSIFLIRIFIQDAWSYSIQNSVGSKRNLWVSGENPLIGLLVSGIKVFLPLLVSLLFILVLNRKNLKSNLLTWIFGSAFFFVTVTMYVVGQVYIFPAFFIYLLLILFLLTFSKSQQEDLEHEAARNMRNIYVVAATVITLTAAQLIPSVTWRDPELRNPVGINNRIIDKIVQDCTQDVDCVDLIKFETLNVGVLVNWSANTSSLNLYSKQRDLSIVFYDLNSGGSENAIEVIRSKTYHYLVHANLSQVQGYKFVDGSDKLSNRYLDTMIESGYEVMPLGISKSTYQTYKLN